MAQHDDSLSLHWVRGEIQETLRQSQHALEAFAENREDLAQLRFCLNHLHQVHGTLRMVQLEGASLVAAEMEALAEALLNHEPGDSDTAIGSLMQSILQLPDYLSTLQSRSEDVPLRLLPLLNDLRAARGETFLSASALFNPDLSPARFQAPAQVNQRLTASGVLDKVRKLQQMFQFARAGLERGVDVDTHLDYLDKVITRLIKLCQRTPQGEIWQAAGALVDTLNSGHNAMGAATLALISDLDGELERLISESDTILSQSVPEDTLKNLLYYVARGADCDSERVSTMVERYRLREALPDDTGDHGQSQAPARAAMASVVDVLTEELNTIKDRLDLFVRAHERSNSDLAELLPGLRQVANTLAMLRQGTSQRVINDQIERIDQLAASSDAVDDGTLMDIAGALLYVEASISGLSGRDDAQDGEQPTHSGEDAHRITGLEATEAGSAVLRESRNALEQVKTGVVNFIASQWNTEAISGVPELLYSIRGSLHLIPLERTATALGACERFIQDVLMDGVWTPNWEQLDTLADAITSIEYHLERLMDGIDDNDAILAMAEERLESLGFPPGREPTRTAPEPDADEATDAAPAESAAATTAEPPKERDSELLDDDILEIFVEEADEVLEAIQQHYPTFRADHENHQALSEVRRAFHTLKGSGRLVGATSIGELAWSVENLLNRVLDRSIQPGERIMSLLDRVIERLPGLIQSFRDGEATGDVDDLMNEAHGLADTRNAEEPEDTDAEHAVREEPEPEPEDRETEAEPQPETTAAPAPETEASAADEPLVDQEILDIFIEEAEEVLETIHEYLPRLLESYENTNALTEVRRAFHTLKGSGRMVEAERIGELAWAVENALNRVLDGTLFMSDDMASVLQEVTNAIPTLVEDFRQQRAPSVDTTRLEERANALARGEVLDAAPMPEAEPEAPAPEAPADELADVEEPELDPMLMDIFRSEADSHLEALDTFLADAEGQNTADYTDNLSRALHTLKGSAHTAGIEPIARVTAPMEKFVKRARAAGDRADAEVISLIRRVRDFVQEGLERLTSDPLTPLEGTDAFLADLRNLHQARYPDETPPAGTTTPETGTVGDNSLISIFLNEGIEQLLDADQTLEQWLEGNTGEAPLQALIDSLATLSASADRAQVQHISELAGALQHLYEEVIETTDLPVDQLTPLLREAHEAMINLMDQLAAGLATESPAGLVTRLNEQAADLRQARTDAEQQVFEERFGGDLASMDEALNEDIEAEPAPEPEPEPEPEPVEQDEAGSGESASADIDPELAEIFLEEAHELIDSTGEALHQYISEPDNTELAKTLQRELHTLKGGARMAEIAPIADLSHSLEDLFERVAEGRLALGEATGDTLLACHDALARMVDQTSAFQPCEPADELTERVHALMRGETAPPAAETEAKEPEPETPEQASTAEAAAEPEAEPTSAPENELSVLFLDEAREIENALEQAVRDWESDPEQGEPMARMREELHTLKGGARLSELEPIAELADTWESTLDSVIEGAGDSHQALNFSQQSLTRLGGMLDRVEAGESLATGAEAGEATTGDEAEDDPSNVDPEVLEIFLEEAGELVDTLDHTLAAWQKAEDGDEATHSQEAQRALHTIKGGARLAELTTLGEKAHRFESLLSRIESGGNRPTEDQWEEIHGLHDEIISRVEQVRRAWQGDAGGEQPEAAAPAPHPGETTGAPEEPAEPEAQTTPETTAGEQQTQPQQQARDQRRAELARSAQETLRVNAQLMDEMVNLAGETSITRGRLEQQISDFSHTLDEMAATTDRLREQLRRMEIETEAQILHRAEQEFGPDYDQDFDPLEMDRYSAIQQLSRALSESASDLADLRETMNDKVRDAETLLLQQQRTNTELQEGLMKTRMVPFSSMVPRLRRIVRQISGETGKKAHFEVNNAEGELDRTVLDRMVAPLEHMLRNAIDHGIEDAGEREQAGKPATGNVRLDLSREGGEVVLRLRDDGGGIETEKVRQKAIKQGLLESGEDLTDHEILQFILQPGFSTAASVTQISGRGVGMDVVASEIKQLGGSLDINSTLGEGTIFTVRLPFTVSVNRALMVTIGDDYYAIPLNTIEGIVRVSTYELEEYYQPDAPMYEYAGQQYRLQYLGALLNSDSQPKLQGQALPLPVMLVRGADQPMALQVDSLMGSREIVVKSLGPQFGSVRGVSGATILGDGNVVVILDLPAMIRGDILAQRQRMLAQVETRETPREQRPTQVMVVDDSVTVRKVTSRLLERHGMEVLLAKDGLDAVGQLQDRRPDIVLLDIEMPRMDGFEVASFIRHDSKLTDVPIIMITSRTGDKHRERAEAIGVNHYLGKPFQEQELLDTIMEHASVGAEQ